MPPALAVWIRIASDPAVLTLPPCSRRVWLAAALEPIVIPTVPVVLPPVPIAMVLVVLVPGVPLAILTVLPPEVVELPPAIFTLWVVLVMFPFSRLKVSVPPVAALERMLIVDVPLVSAFWILIVWPAVVVAWPMVMVPVEVVPPPMVALPPPAKLTVPVTLMPPVPCI